MSGRARRARKPFGLRARLLLVLAVLAGLVAMHGLGPQAVPAAAHTSGRATGHTPAHTPAAMAVAAGHEEFLPAGDSPEDGGGHSQHADATCAAAGVGGAPVLPAPGLVKAGPAAAATVAHGTTSDAAAYGRPPPSLSELQLLRI
ncbi:DUF6153 family protein [Streptomyces sp. NPDC003038]|uniref:DUF6153 family protein n=1 Tax=unclassified Streptomyces TaxID=2593676 RepID=UPI0033B49C75